MLLEKILGLKLMSEAPEEERMDVLTLERIIFEIGRLSYWWVVIED